jgi:hypothetical protein
MFTWLFVALQFTSSRALGQLPVDRRPDEIDGNSKTWRTFAGPLSEQQGVSGQRQGVNESGNVVQIESGMHFWNGKEWMPSTASFAATAEGFKALQVQHPVELNGNLNQEGAVKMVTPDGAPLRSTPLAIALSDPATDRFLVIAQITDCSGIIVSSNQVLFPDAFSGGVCADILYTIQKGSFEQDVILTGRLDPEDFGFPKDSRIQIITEFYDAPIPQRLRRPLYVERNEKKRQQRINPDLMDEVLTFGRLTFGTGRAFTTPTGLNTNGVQAVVGKQFSTIDGRKLLFETVDNSSIRAELLELPECKQTPLSFYQNVKAREGYAFIPKAPSVARPDTREKLVARSEAVAELYKNRAGVVVDYVATLDSGITTLRGDTTYYVSGATYCGLGIIEAGAVIKYGDGASIDMGGMSTIKCPSAGYRPAIFTSVNDDTVGVTLSGFPGYNGFIGTGGYASPALRISSMSMESSFLSNLRFMYAKEAVRYEGSFYSSIAHCQFVQCIRGIVLNGGGDGSGSGGGYGRVMVFNSLFADLQAVMSVTGMEYYAGSGPGSFSFCTIDTSSQFIENDNPMNEFYLENCIFENVFTLGWGYLSGAHNSFFNVGKANYTGSDDPPDLLSTPFQSSVGGGGHYLKADSPCRGTASGSNSEIAARTTQPPLLQTAAITVNTTWAKRGIEDTGPLDPGYHYDVLDYLVSQVALSAELILGQGLAVGFNGSGINACGINLLSGGHIKSIGHPKALNRICYQGNVQENSIGQYAAPFMRMATAAGSRMTFRFTDFSTCPGGPPNGAANYSSILLVPAGSSASGELDIRDSHVRGGTLGVTPSGTGSTLIIGLTNNLIEYCTLPMTRSAGVPLAFHAYNNLFRKSKLNISYQGTAGATWYINDNLFDDTTQLVSGLSSCVAASHNGFSSGLQNILGGTDNKTGLTMGYVSGPLGAYYYPASGGATTLAALINAGSRNAADAGLFHHTVKAVANSKEGTDQPATVDIGYHYIVLNSAGNPTDSDGDGIPDYEDDDWDGDGVLNWMDGDPNDSAVGGLYITIEMPINGTTIR